jgi:hypothetical protein
MSEVKVNKISPRTACGTVTLGDSGDTFTIPSGATITNAGTASGFGATGETSWDTTVKTTGTFTATAGVGYFLNTTGGIITVNLAAGTAGDSVAMADYAGTWQTNNVTVAANGTEKIGGVDADVILSTEGQSVTFVYVDGTQGWVNVLDSTSNVRGNEFVVATGGTPCTGAISGNCKVHTFTGPGTFCVSDIGACAANNVVSYMVVAGGGGGGNNGGGGGAGGFREYKSPVTPYTASPLDGNPCGTAITVSASPYAITVGGGGASGGGYPSATQANGLDSVFSTITSTGGGKGGSSPPATTAGTGGSGGGGGQSPTSGGAGDTPPTTPNQGFAGGDASGPCGFGGGGGATAVGFAAVGTAGGVGGAGATSSIDATPTARAGGAGGGGFGSPAGYPGGAGGGGKGSFTDGTGGAGTVNTGGGGGGTAGGCSGPGGAGGSGVVIIRYKFQ